MTIESNKITFNVDLILLNINTRFTDIDQILQFKIIDDRSTYHQIFTLKKLNLRWRLLLHTKFKNNNSNHKISQVITSFNSFYSTIAILIQRISRLIMIKNIRRVSHCFSQNKVTILHSNTNDIYFNLATQQYLYEAELKNPILFLWRNNKTIVIGRHQNPWKECHLNVMEREAVALSRRITGGGAVYHDLGNTCFSFLTPFATDQQYNYKTVNNQILLKALDKLGISAQVSGRNDITHDGKKISGSAYKLNIGNPKTGKGKKSLHHGTVLFNVDTKALVNYLNPNKAKLLSKGITSVASRVLNLSDKFPSANHQSFSRSAQQSFLQYYKPLQVQKRTLDYDQLKVNPKIKQRFQELRSWEWLYGKSPNFTNNLEHRFTWGIIDIFFDVEEGIIKDGVVYSDSLNPDLVSSIQEQVKTGKLTYDFDGIKKLKQRLDQKFESKETQEQISELCQWLKEAM